MRDSRERINKLATNRLVIVSNRLPVAPIRVDKGQWQVQPSPGGLVTALTPILSEKGGLWIGWPGTLENVDFHEFIDRTDAEQIMALDDDAYHGELVSCGCLDKFDQKRLVVYHVEGVEEAFERRRTKYTLTPTL